MKIFRLSIFLLLLCFFVPCVFSEEVVDEEFGYSLDLPEGFSVLEYTPDGMSYLFRHAAAPVFFLLKLYTGDSEVSPSESLSLAMSRLGGKCDMDMIVWRNAPSAVARFEMTLPGQDLSRGWGVSVSLPGKNASLVLLCYSDEKNFEPWQNFMLSSLNSLSIDRGSRSSPGIIASYAYPESEGVKVLLDIAGRKVSTEVKKDDAEASMFVRDMEFSVLSLYAEHPKWKEAWKRYYRAIYRDGAGRLKRASHDIYSALYDECVRMNPENPMAAMNGILLSWVQDMPYVRDTGSAKRSDLTDPVSTVLGKGSDCDSRSLLVSAMLRNMGVDSCLFISREYSHALYGVRLDMQGARLEVEGLAYVLNETTARGVGPGLVAKDFSVSEYWIPVTFD